MPDISERNFEETIEAALLAGGPDSRPEFEGVVAEPVATFGAYAPGGYRKRPPNDYDKVLSVDRAARTVTVQAGIRIKKLRAFPRGSRSGCLKGVRWRWT